MDRTFPFIHVITNGTIRIPEEFNHKLFVSIDGPHKTNDAIKENYSGEKRVIINMRITKDNYKEIEHAIKIVKENGFSGVVCNICASGTDVSVPMF